MDQVIQNLWLGDISSVADVENLKKNNIRSILSAVRGKLAVQAVRVSPQRSTDSKSLSPQQAFTHKQIEIDDTDEEDILNHLTASISFIEAELEKGHGILVHCQAGMSAATFTSDLSLPVAQSSFRPQCGHRRCVSHVFSRP